jgi:hypothetical protein
MTEGESNKYRNYAHIRRPAIISEECFGGREWESNPPRTGRRPFLGFEVRTPHQGRFPSKPNGISRLSLMRFHMTDAFARGFARAVKSIK